MLRNKEKPHNSETETNKILFKKPDLEYMLPRFNVVDMHFHSKYSDGINKIPVILKHAKKLGIGIAITDHNIVDGAVEACNQQEVLVIPGVEITSTEGPHMLLYFYNVEDIIDFNDKYLKKNKGKTPMYSTKLSVKEIIKIGNKYNCLIVFAHPYSFGTTGIYTKHFSHKRKHDIIDSVGTFEVINSENFHIWNLMAGVKAYNLNKGMIGGSDGHTLYHMAKVLTYTKKKKFTDMSKAREYFLDQIKLKQSRVIGRDVDILRKFISTVFKIKPNLRKMPGLIMKSTILKIPFIANLIK